MKTLVIPIHKTAIQRDEAETQSAKIKAEYEVKEAKLKKGTTAPTLTLRQKILSLSLFPNPYNRKMILKYGE